MVLKQLVVFADSDVSLRLETVADQAAISSNTVSPAPLRIRRSTLKCLIHLRIPLNIYCFVHQATNNIILLRVT